MSDPGDGRHELRRRSFNTNAAAYREGRPPYPEQVYDILAAECGLRAGCRVVEIGAGSGLATGPLLAAGATVHAIEPGADLATLLTSVHGSDRLTVTVADFEIADLPAKSFDLAVAATSLHWLDMATAIPKLASLVTADGSLAVWWNIFGPADQATAFRDRLDILYRELLPAEPGYQDSRPYPLDTDRWRTQIEGGGWFGPVTARVMHWTNTLTAQSATRLWSTFPNIAELDPATRQRFLTGLATIIDNEFGGTVNDPHLTALYTAPRTDQIWTPAPAGSSHRSTTR